MVSRSENRARANAGWPGFGVSGVDVGWANFARIDAGNFEPRSYFSITLQASATVVGSGSVGPDASADSYPAGTSVMARDSFIEAAASAANRPPFTADKCFRTALISAIEAPQFTSRRFS